MLPSPASATRPSSPFVRHGLAVAAIAALAALAACGGGGGGGGDGGAPAAVTPLSLSSGNAKAAASDALENMEASPALAGTDVISGLKSQPAQGPASGFRSLAKIALALAAKASAGGTFMKAAVDQTVPCDFGGTLTVRGNLGSSSGFVAGDSVTLSASNCGLAFDGTQGTIHGGMSITVNSGSLIGYPFAVTISMVATDMRIQSGGETFTSNGDVKLEWSASSATSQTLVATGNSFSNTLVTGNTTRTARWKAYREESVLAGTEVRSRLDGTLEALNTRLSGNYVSYQIATPVTVVVNAGTYNAGTVLLTGGKSSLQMVFKPGNAVDLVLDADGNGSYEQTIASTVVELRNLP